MLDSYNAAMREQGAEDKVIQYTDVVGTLMTSVTRIINMISNMLVAFVPISLVVSFHYDRHHTPISACWSAARRSASCVPSVLPSGTSPRCSTPRPSSSACARASWASASADCCSFRATCSSRNHSRPGTSVVAVLPWKAAVVLVALATVLTILGRLHPRQNRFPL